MSEIKDSGKKREFETGAHRDFAEGKGRCDLLPIKYVSIAYDKLYENKTSIASDSKEDYLECALSYLLRAVENSRDDLGIYWAIILCAIAEGINENENTKDCKKFSYCGMFSYGMIQVSKHYEEGAKKYGENNWQNGMPCHVYLDSAMRHLMKSIAGMDDEPHIRATCWNLLCYLWTKDNKPELFDL